MDVETFSLCIFIGVAALLILAYLAGYRNGSDNAITTIRPAPGFGDDFVTGKCPCGCGLDQKRV